VDVVRRLPQNLSTIFTIGHSTRPIEQFVALLCAHGVKRLVDVRTMPRSRHNPQFNRDALQETLPRSGIDYLHLPDLGGLRQPQPDSPNAGWRNASFRGYADYMQTVTFQAAVEQLIALSAECSTAIMCAEAVPWRCHRSLIADALNVRGIPVEEIVDERRSRPHRLTSWAKADGVKLTYPSEPNEPEQPGQTQEEGNAPEEAC
jgi:uncharacterized protein (DUF488 family)